jgi:ABC-type multidrug transport system ATPase subunit
MIIAQRLEKRFGRRRVLSGLTLEVNPGVVTLLVGANGAGKSTLLRIIAGLCRPDAGRVEVAGRDIVQQRLAAVGELAFLPQAPRFHPRLTTRQVAGYYADLRGRGEADAAEELIRWGLQDHFTATTSELSGGLRQRLAIAVFALARAPVLLLDEPGLSLDPEWRVKLQAHLSAEAARGATVLVATHLLGEWEGKIDACVLLNDGRVGGALPPDRLRESFPVPERVSAS